MITSQIDTAPKLVVNLRFRSWCLITSQIDTAPKRRDILEDAIVGLITSQIDTAPKQDFKKYGTPCEFDYQSD